jgi:hypothetical protein
VRREKGKKTYTSDDSALLGVSDVAEDVLESSVEAVADVAAEDTVRRGADGGSDRVDNLVEGLVESGTGGLHMKKKEGSARAPDEMRSVGQEGGIGEGKVRKEGNDCRQTATRASFWALATLPRMFFKAVLRPLPTLPPRMPSVGAPTGVATESTTSSRSWSSPSPVVCRNGGIKRQRERREVETGGRNTRVSRGRW